VALSWMDIGVLTILVSLAGVLTARILSHLRSRHAWEMRRNRKLACRPHSWVRREAGGAVAHPYRHLQRPSGHPV
jgi:hypothetical protein